MLATQLAEQLFIVRKSIEIACPDTVIGRVLKVIESRLTDSAVAAVSAGMGEDSYHYGETTGLGARLYQEQTSGSLSVRDSRTVDAIIDTILGNTPA